MKDINTVLSATYIVSPAEEWFRVNFVDLHEGSEDEEEPTVHFMDEDTGMEYSEPFSELADYQAYGLRKIEE